MCQERSQGSQVNYCNEMIIFKVNTSIGFQSVDLKLDFFHKIGQIATEFLPA